MEFYHQFEGTSPVEFTHLQFPLQLCYAMTIDKSQGETFTGKVGLYLNDGVFSHGQLYVALTRAISFKNISICYAISPALGWQSALLTTEVPIMQLYNLY
jgi:hypothetical protein